MSQIRRLWLLVTLFLSSVPGKLLAQGAPANRTLIVNGGNLSLELIITRIINYMAGVIVFFALVMFVIGAFIITFSRGDSDKVKRGKDMVIGAVIGMGVVLGAFSILRTVFYIIYS